MAETVHEAEAIYGEAEPPSQGHKN